MFLRFHEILMVAIATSILALLPLQANFFVYIFEDFFHLLLVKNAV